MGIAFLHGQNGGGGELNFKVVGSETAPSNPKENTIWVKTSLPISEFEISEVDNPTWEMATGFVYITYTAIGGWANRETTGLNFLKKNYIWARLLRCHQYNGSTHNSLDAYIYRGSSWIQFSTTFTATINITYPAGSTCTATCDNTTLTAPDTSGTWSCKVDKPGTWTVTVTGKWSDTVSVTTSGSTVSLDVSKFWLYQPGNTHSNRTGGWKTAAGITGNYTENSVTFGAAGSNGATLALKTGANASCYMQTNSAVNLSNFTKLVFVFTGTVSSQHSYVSSNSSNPGAWDNKATSLREDSVGTKMIDISSLSGSYYIYLGHFTSSSFVTAYVKEVYLQ